MLVIDRMNLLICYKIIMGPMRFFSPGAHSKLKPALTRITYSIRFVVLNCRN